MRIRLFIGQRKGHYLYNEIHFSMNKIEITNQTKVDKRERRRGEEQ